jgi:hypothetical protein
MQQKKKKENEKNKGKNKLPCTATMSSWRLKRQRPVVN